ncbi:MAG: GntR family transcriptional regulator [Deltaproteobacteria bacterium]|nr:GntR family transcriptional regulator [Deltaproteobacteria bacterium]MBW1924193.1 GntR family transcriptional regulator [Deltaproteobacteria bacterium]MBW1950208.1 GntR family transcriptional regulator [Deltaproteobacteria bacterium]MBW2009594.1 GntR family transcriptional regulator [Deltaproteobacteria bacterium]MBW2103680.1 GntR family transcriptional regulator [Deltaproteobacteria bacterium]
MLDLKPLREQIYQYLRREMQGGDLLPGSTIDMTRISRELGVSKTPLRDALIRLEADGFVEILPRRGVRVRVITFHDIRNIYEVVGSLETTVISSCLDRFNRKKLRAMKRINGQYREAVMKGDAEGIYRTNLAFHDTFLQLSQNRELLSIIAPLKQRLYDFPRRAYLPEWELRNAEEHERLMEAVESRDLEAVHRVWKDQHWSYAYQQSFIRRFYAMGIKEYEEDMANLEKRRKRGS